MPDQNKAAVRYTGDGDYIPGIPARDMSKLEWESLPKSEREKALALGLYELEGKPAHKPAPEPSTKKDGDQ